MTAPHTAVALDECVAQLDRTAAWLRSLPLARFAHNHGAVADQARDLIAQVAACVQHLCEALQEQGAVSSDDAHAWQAADCPPPSAVPDRLGVHALGDQLAVHAADLARCGSASASVGLTPPGDVLGSLSAAALRLRAGT